LELVDQLDETKMAHVVTDAGKNTNPGKAELGALIQHNGAFTWISGH
jgi:hypothetical protein